MKRGEKMERVRGRRWLWSVLSVALMSGLAISWVPEARAEQKTSLAILPFLVERGEDPGRGAMCPLCKGVYRKGEILPGSQNTLALLLYQKVETMGTLKVVPLEKMEEVFSKRDKRLFEERPIPSSIQLGKELNVGFILVGFLFRFEERIGSSLGVERPASVGFDVHLFRLNDERMVWQGKLDETQRPLSENLFKIGSFFRRKAQWLTAEELSSVGMDEMLKRFPGPKELEEMP
jgi:hypothetical protein